MCDQEWRRWLANGNPEALEAVLEVWLPALRHQVLRFGPQIAEDALQDGLVELLAGREGIEPTEPVAMVLTRFVQQAGSRCAGRHRRAQRRLRRLPDDLAFCHVTAPADIPRIPAQDLPIFLAAANNSCAAQAAASLGIGLCAFTVRLHRARRRIVVGARRPRALAG